MQHEKSKNQKVKIDLEKYYICWTTRILPVIVENGFKLAQNVEGTNCNPYYDMKPRIDPVTGELRTEGRWGHVYERTPELMAVVSSLSDPNKIPKK